MSKVIYRWKGRIVTKKMYEKKKRMAENFGKKSPKSSNSKGSEKSEVMLQEKVEFEECIIKQKEIEPKEENEGKKEPEEQPILQLPECVLIKEEEYHQEEENEISEKPKQQEEPVYFSGRRIVDLKLLAAEMWCCSCKEALSFQFIEKEVRRGFGSILTIRCHKCSVLNIVTTGKQYSQHERRNTARFEINTNAVQGAIQSGVNFTNLKKLCGHLDVPCLDAKAFKKYKDELKVSIESDANVDDT